MKNAHQRFGRVSYVRRSEKTATNIRLHLDAFVGEDPGKAHLVSAIGGDSEIGALAAAFGNGDPFTVIEPSGKEAIVSLGEKPLCFRGSIMVDRQLPIAGTRRSRLEVPTTPKAVALRHLASHVDDLAISGELSQDSANSQGLELLNWGFLSVRRCRWGPCLRDLLFVVHAQALSPRRWRQSRHGR